MGGKICDGQYQIGLGGVSMDLRQPTCTPLACDNPSDVRSIPSKALALHSTSNSDARRDGARRPKAGGLLRLLMPRSPPVRASCASI